MEHLLAVTFILSGAGLLLLSILKSRQILGLLKAYKHLRYWQYCCFLIIFLLGGCLVTLLPVFPNLTELLRLLIGLVFLFGAVVVYLVVHAAHLTLDDMLHTIIQLEQTEKELTTRRDHLEELINVRTIELSDANTELDRNVAEHKRVEEFLQQRNRELALLNQVSQLFNSTLELHEVLVTILSETRQLLGIMAASFWVVISGTRELVCQQSVGPDSEDVIGWRLPMGQGIVGKAAQTGDILNVPDTRADEQHYKGVDLKTGLEIRSNVSIPLKVKGSVIGVLSLVDTTPHRFTTDDLKLLASVSSAAAIAIENARLYAAVREAKEAAEKANQSKSMFLANMSHELRTPLNAIIGYSEMLMEDAEDQESDAFLPDLQKIHHAGKHLMTLINDILDISKIEAGKMELYLETFDVSQLITDTVSAIQPLVEKNANTLHVHGAENLGTIYADLTKVWQSLLNLLSNACKFTERGAITLMAKRDTVEGKDWITLSVHDTGIGMTDEHMARLFHAFTQADGSMTRKYGGTGLGLAITKRFCQMMGGDIAVESEYGSGSIFTIRLPAVVSESQVDSASLRTSLRSVSGDCRAESREVVVFE